MCGGGVHDYGSWVLARQARTRAVSCGIENGIDRDGVSFDKGRAEERKALNVIPVRMSEENVRLNGAFLPWTISSAANRCAPVPQSKIRRSPLAVVSSTQDV